MNADHVADYFIRKAASEDGDGITHLKIQKLLYYSQGWHLALHESPLFREKIEAWAHGPVCPSVWRRLKDRNWEPLTVRKDTVGTGSETTAKDVRFLDEVWSVYGQFTAKRLEEMTHQEKPYLTARGNLPEYAKCSTVISLESMKSFFKSLQN